MRVIAGKYKKRQLKVPKSQLTRPTTDKNKEILIHIGIDTVKFGGKQFKQFVEKGQRVKQGDLLIEFDKELLKQGDADLTTMVVITNSNDYLEIIPTKEKRVKMNDDLLTVI